jgi:hypothetical protein
MSTTFLFIDATKTDAGTRRKARSHAMKGKNVGKKHYNRRTKQAKQSWPTIHDLDYATSTDSDPQDDRSMQDFLLPISPVLLHTISEDFIMPMHLQTNATPQSQHVIRQCEWHPEALDGGDWAWPATYTDQSCPKSRIALTPRRSVLFPNMSVAG